MQRISLISDKFVPQNNISNLESLPIVLTKKRASNKTSRGMSPRGAEVTNKNDETVKNDFPQEQDAQKKQQFNTESALIGNNTTTERDSVDKTFNMEVTEGETLN